MPAFHFRPMPLKLSSIALLGREPLHVDEIGSLSRLPIEQISATLTMMELKGLVRQVGGMRYIAVFERGANYLVHRIGRAGNR